MRYWPARRSTASQDLANHFREALDGQEVSKEQLFEFLRKRFLSIARYRLPEAAEDVVQETLIVVHQRFSEFLTLDGLIAFTNQVLRNKIGNAYQEGYRRGRSELGDRDSGQRMDDELEGGEFDRIVRASIDKLSSRQSVCGDILGCLYNGLEPTEISSRLGITKSKLKVQTFRCRQALRNLLSAEYGLEW